MMKTNEGTTRAPRRVHGAAFATGSFKKDDGWRRREEMSDRRSPVCGSWHGRYKPRQTPVSEASMDGRSGRYEVI